MVKALLKTMRPKQWLKNGFVFAPLIFDVKLFNWRYVAKSVAGFVLLCVVSGAVYIINDLVDINKDRQHPLKRFRPIPSGQLGTQPAIVAAVAMLLLAMPLGFVLDPLFGAVLLTYLAIQIAYSFWLKRIVIIDVMVIAAGFLLRVAAGVPLVAAEQGFSPWLYICMTLLALLIGFGKRRHELTLLGQNANLHRQSLQEYNLTLLDQIITIVTASTLLAYSLYTFSAPNLPANRAMMLTIPFVMYGMFRYLYLIHVKHMGGAPEEIVLTDRPLQLAVLLWGLSAVIVLYIARFLP